MTSIPPYTASSTVPRMPKLKYKTPLPDAHTPSHASPPRPPTQDSAGTPTSSTPSWETTSAMSVSFVSSSSAASTTSSEIGSVRTNSTSKKKTTAVLGFFTLKEPSHAALEKFAQQQRKPSTRKSSSPSATATVTGTFANKHLPANVPKVNSKWDGVPEAVKRRHESLPLSVKTPRSSIYSRRGHDLSSVTKIQHQSGPTKTEEDVDPPPVLCESLPAPVSSFAKEIQESISHARSASPSSFSSSRDSVDISVKDAAETILNKLNHPAVPPSWNAAPPTLSSVESGQRENIPDSHDFLFDSSSANAASDWNAAVTLPFSVHDVPARTVHNFSRPIMPDDPPAAHHTSLSRPPFPDAVLPTLYEASFVSTESLATVQYDIDSLSIAPSTIAPSELSKRWFKSPQERLGLGGRLRLQDVMPWENGEDKPRKNRLSIFGLGAAKG